MTEDILREINRRRWDEDQERLEQFKKSSWWNQMWHWIWHKLMGIGYWRVEVHRDSLNGPVRTGFWCIYCGEYADKCRPKRP